MKSGHPRRAGVAAASSSPNGLPQFCDGPTLFALMVVAELVVLVIVLVPEENTRPWLPRLGVLSLYVQWLALLGAVVLCSLRPMFERLGARAGLMVAWATAVGVTALGSLAVARIDQALGLGLGVPPSETAHFVAANAAICALIAAALLRYLYVLEQWRERVRAAAKAQVDAVQARIRPHFLFNSMNTIASLIRTRPEQAERTVEDLSDLFRAALGADDAPGTLGDELDLVLRYLDIEKLRLGDRLVLDLDVAGLPRGFAMPRLLLQPLIENAIYHGIQPRADGGTLRLHGRSVAGGIEIAIANPLAPGATARRNGIALANVRARIGYHFGTRGDLRVESGDERYTVTVHLPEATVR